MGNVYFDVVVLSWILCACLLSRSMQKTKPKGGRVHSAESPDQRSAVSGALVNCHYLDSFLEVVWAANDFRMSHSLLEDHSRNLEVLSWLAKSRMKLEIACAQYVFERDTILRP